MRFQTQISGHMAEIDRLNSEVRALFDAADRDGGRELSTDERQRVIDNNKRIEEREHKVLDLRNDSELYSASENRSRQMNTVAGGMRTAEGEAREARTVGERFVSDQSFAQYMTEVRSGNGEIHQDRRIQSPAVEYRGLRDLTERRTLVTGASGTSAGALIISQDLGLQDLGTNQRPLMIRQLCTQGQTTSDTVEYVRIGTFTNNAAPVPEAATTDDATAVAPESALALARVTTNVRDIAHHIPLTKRAMADAAQVATLVDGFLVYGLEEEVDTQLISGDGTGENLLGVLSAGIGAQAFISDILTSTRKGRTKVSTEGRALASAYVMNPLQWEAFDLLQDNEERYFFGGPSVIGNPRLWGLPVVESEAVANGRAIVADWRKAIVWDRQQASIVATDFHSDYFTKRLVAVMGTVRLAFAVIRPSAFIDIDLTA